jgi:hypothetical protein
VKAPILPLAAAASVLGLLAGVYASRPAESAPPPPPPPRETPAAAPAADGSEVTCAFPLRWRVARIDGEFGLSAADANATMERAAQLWEDSDGRDLFVRDDAAGFPVAFVFDGRQAATQELSERRAELDQQEAELLAEGEQLRERRDRFMRAHADYTNRRNAFNQWASSHNAVVRQWNRDGNIPQEILRELSANDDRLRLEQAKLEGEGTTLGAEEEALNAELADYDDRVGEHQRRTEALDRMSETGSVLAGRFLQGATPDGRLIATMREVQIFQFDDLEHLRLVMAHELGHALGLSHSDEPTAVMAEEHELAGAAGIPSGLHPSDAEALRERCPRP